REELNEAYGTDHGKRKENQKETRTYYMDFYQPSAWNLCGKYFSLLGPGGICERYHLCKRYFLCAGERIHPPDADVGGTAGILLAGLRKHGDGRFQEPGKGRDQSHRIL